jgi:hypoxanthine phosphoribosyltransferase
VTKPPELEVLIPAAQLAQRVHQMAQQIQHDAPGGVHFVAVLKGAFIFLSDLVRSLECPVSIDFIGVASYGDGTTAAGLPRMVKDLERPVAGRDVVIVEDIVDSGATLAALQTLVRSRNPRSLRTACLLDKPARRRVPVVVDYVGFTIDDRFVVGYGLDHADRYRNLPHIAAVNSLS